MTFTTTTFADTNNETYTMEKFLEAKKIIDNLPKLPPPMQIIESPYLVDYHTEQIKYPRSRKKRIQKKFKKLWTYSWATPKKECYHITDRNIIICHPVIAQKIKRAIRSGQKG